MEKEKFGNYFVMFCLGSIAMAFVANFAIL